MSTSKEPLEPEPRRNSRGLRWLKGILTLISVLLANFPSLTVLAPLQTTDRKEIHGHSVFTLRDGTKGVVWAGGLISYDNAEFNKRLREITATGDVYMNVHPDNDKEFVVHCEGRLKLRSYGAVFEKKINAADGRVHVLVAEGCVEVLDETGRSLGYLRKGVEATIHTQTHDIKTIKYDDVVITENGLEPLLLFENVTMAQVGIRLQQYYGIMVSVSPAIRECMIYASFPENEDITMVMVNIQKSLRGMEYRIIRDNYGNVKEVKISGRACKNSVPMKRIPEGATQNR